MSDGYMIDQRTAERLKRVLLWAETQMALSVDKGGQRPNWQFVRVTGAKDGDYYPGEVVLWDATAEALVVTGTCWIYNLTEGLLSTDTPPIFSRQSGNFENTGDTRTVFVCSVGVAPGDGDQDTTIELITSQCVGGVLTDTTTTLTFPFAVEVETS